VDPVEEQLSKSVKGFASSLWNWPADGAVFDILIVLNI
jgi:hypothetical protein